MPSQTRQRAARWLIAAVYTVLIYTLAWYVNPMWTALTHAMGVEAGGNFVNRAVPILGALVLAAILLRYRLANLWAYLWLLAVAAGYAYVLTLRAEYPVERVHLIQYSLVACVYFFALRVDLTDRAAYLGAALAVFLVGLSDELIQQYIIPGRSGTLEDMIINWFSGGLGLVALLAIRRGGIWAFHLRLRPSLRLATGLVLPLALAGFWSYEVYTKYLFPPLNLVLITVDCARPDFMSTYGYQSDPPTTYYIDAQARHGAVFTQAYSQAAWTSPGVASVLTGMYPPTHGVTSQDQTLPQVVTTLLDGFKQHGYKIPALSYLINAAPNFLNLADFDDPEVDIHTGNEVTKIVNWIHRNHRKPFAIWYHWRYLHLPYDPPPVHWRYPPAYIPEDKLPGNRTDGVDPRDELPMPDDIRNVIRKEVIVPFFSEEVREEAEKSGLPPAPDAPRQYHFTGEDKAWVRALYAAQMRQFDYNFERIRYTLALHHKLKNTIFIITADHAEELLDHGYVGHASTQVHSRHYDELIHIPLIVMCPRLIHRGRTIDVTAQQVDILPTVFDMMGWDVPKEVQGRSLYPAIQGKPMDDVPVFSESVEGGYQSKPNQRTTYVRSIRTKDWKFIARMGPRGDQFELYNLVDDPGETKNVYAEYPHITGDFIQKLGEWITQNVDERLTLEQREERHELRMAAQKPENLSVPEILEPADGDTIYYDTLDGAVEAEWTGNPYAAYIIEYDVGEGWHRLRGKYPVDEGTKHVFGPLPPDGWKPLYQWNPYRLRIRPRDLPGGWSDWITINVAPLDAHPGPGESEDD